MQHTSLLPQNRVKFGKYFTQGWKKLTQALLACFLVFPSLCLGDDNDDHDDHDDHYNAGDDDRHHDDNQDEDEGEDDDNEDEDDDNDDNDHDDNNDNDYFDDDVDDVDGDYWDDDEDHDNYDDDDEGLVTNDAIFWGVSRPPPLPPCHGISLFGMSQPGAPGGPFSATYK